MATSKKTAAKKTVSKKSVAKKTVAKKPVAKKTVAKKAPAKTAKPKLTVKGKTPKEVATAKGEPYVNITSVELDTDDIGNGAFELDWNDKFIVQLVKAGYQAKPNEEESVIVDRWFKTVCRNILTEEFEQWEANQPEEMRPRVIDRRDLGDGLTELS